MSTSITGTLSTSVRELDEQAVVAARGEIDLATAPQLRDTLREVLDAGRHRIVLDLTDVTFCDSTGLGVMVGALRRIRSLDAGGNLSVVCSGPPVRRVFELTGLNKVFSLHTDLATALEGGSQSGYDACRC